MTASPSCSASRPARRWCTTGQLKLNPGARCDRQQSAADAGRRPAKAVGTDADVVHRHLHPPPGARHRGEPADPAGRARLRLQPADAPVSASITNTTITITTAYPGANADLIKGFITTPIQQAVASAEGIDTLALLLAAERLAITLNLRLDANADRAVADVLSKVQQVKSVLPREVAGSGGDQADRRDHGAHVHVVQQQGDDAARRSPTT